MNGLAAVWNFDGAPAEPQLAAVAGRILDSGANTNAAGSAALAAGPRGLASGAVLVLAADARLDNSGELIAQLAAPAGASDAELIRAAYQRWDEDCPSRLLGDFAFAVWDGARRQMFCARDQLGVKQLYFHAGARVFVCASSADAVAAHPLAPAEPDPEELARALLDHFPEPDKTAYAGIRRVPPAHSMWVSARGVRVSRYWDPAAAREVRYEDEREYVEHFRDLFGRAVAGRMPAAGPVAAAMSGGLDSASMVCMARRLEACAGQPGRLQVHSVVFDTLPCDERRFMREVAQATGIAPHYWPADDTGLELERFAALPGVPCHPTFGMLLEMLAGAREQGAGAMLWGFGGDELLTSGSSHITDLVRERRWAGAARALWDRAGRQPQRLPGLAWDACIRPLAPRIARRALRRCLPAASAPRWLKTGVPQRVETPDAGGRFRGAVQERIAAGLSRSRLLDLTLPAADALARAFRLEFRYPFYDRRIAEFVLGLPAERLDLLTGKLLLREAMAGILPEAIRLRTDKTGFNALVDREFRERGAGIIRALIADSELARRGTIDGREFQNLFERYCRRPDGSGKDSVAAFLRTEMWLRTLGRETRNISYDEIPDRTTASGRKEAVLRSAAGHAW